jgi:hypothetical protein
MEHSVRGTVRRETSLTKALSKDQRFRQRKSMNGDMEAHASNRRLSKKLEQNGRPQTGLIPLRRMRKSHDREA